MSERPYCVAAVLVETSSGDEKHTLYLAAAGRFTINRELMKPGGRSSEEPVTGQQALEWLQRNKLSRILDVNDVVREACQRVL